MDHLPSLSATQTAARIRSGQLSVYELVLQTLERIEQLNPGINAVVAMRSRDELLSEAKEKDALLKKGIVLGTLHGIPMTVKDSFSVKGLRNSNGHPAYRNHIATEDAELVQSLKQAGAIIIGKTNLPLFSIDWQTRNWWYGRTNNPYDPDRTCGGSSGGSAAAVASGMSLLELGSDAGGSIRVPAHFCGVCGLRTTEQALSNRGQYKFPGKPQGHRHLTVAGPIAKNVTDLLLLMPVLWNRAPGRSNKPPVEFECSSWKGEKLIIAYGQTINGVPVEQEYEELFGKFIKAISASVHQVSEASPCYNEQQAYLMHGRLLGFEIDAGSPVPAGLTQIFFYLFILLRYRDARWAKGVADGIGMSAKRYLQTLDNKDRVTESFAQFFQGFDVWITPVASFGAFGHQRTGKPFLVNGKQTGYTQAMGGFNFSTAMSGHPIVVIPIGKTSNGMPVGVQIHGPKWSDKRLLEIAQHFESFVHFNPRP